MAEQDRNIYDSSGRQVFIATQLADWTRSDEYHNSYLISPDPDLRGAAERNRAKGLDDIAVSEAQGKFLYLLAKSINASKILEVGTLGGYSTIWLAKALPSNGELITCELSATNALAAKENFEAAGLSSKIKILIGPAVETLVTITADKNESFDLVFIDADKPNNVNYFKHAERLVRHGGVIIVDNVVRHGRVGDPSVTGDSRVEGVRDLLKYIQTNDQVEATTIATVGTKGYDGFLYAIKK